MPELVHSLLQLAGTFDDLNAPLDYYATTIRFCPRKKNLAMNSYRILIISIVTNSTIITSKGDFSIVVLVPPFIYVCVYIFIDIHIFFQLIKFFLKKSTRPRKINTVGDKCKLLYISC